jgi:hypothetical protein
MRRRIFEEGGPHKIRRVGDEKVEMSISIPSDAGGRTARQCPDPNCSPGYFKVKFGTGITSGQETAYCPYCRHSAAPDAFITSEQRRFAKDVLLEEAQKGFQAMLGEAFSGSRSGRRSPGGDFLSIDISFKPGKIKTARRPFEDEVRRDVVCRHCTLDHTVFGLATWCPDCGQEIFLQHVAAELAVVRAMLGDVDRRESLLGMRVAAKDLENCVEDAVSIFEASLRAMVRRALLQRGESIDDVAARMKRIGNAFQNVARTQQVLSELFKLDLAGAVDWSGLSASFEKRHPIAHNLGVVDRKYLERAQQYEAEGREVRISPEEIGSLLDAVERAVTAIRARLPIS